MSHREKFNMLDRNGDGFIDARELKDVLGASKHDVDLLIREVSFYIDTRDIYQHIRIL